MSQLIVRFGSLSEGKIKCSAWFRIQKPFAEMQENILRFFWRWNNPPLEHSCISLIALKIVNDFFSYFELLLVYPWRFCDIGINVDPALRTIWPTVHQE